MAKSKYEYVREYEELNDNALNDCYIGMITIFLS